jgi:inosine-uridine nucleoside N-ribohydrolase
MAIFMALASPELDVVGLTTIFGNAATINTTRNARVLLDAAGRHDIPVAAGAENSLTGQYVGPVPWVHGHNGLGDATIAEPSCPPIAAPAHEFLYSMVTASPGAITLLAVGPLTNLGLALQQHPDIVDLVSEVVVMGGNALVPGNATPVAEANINNDPEAADLVFGASWRVTMVGLDVTHKVNLSGAAIDRISAVDTPMAALLGEAIPLYRNFFETRNHVDGIFVHDPSAVAYLLDPDAFTTAQWPIRVETQSFSRGKTWPNMGDTDDSAPPAWRGRPAVNVCVEVDSPWVLRLLEDRLSRV